MNDSLVKSDIYIKHSCFENLTGYELYAILKLRQDVFMLEQQSFYEDIDNKDLVAQHFLLYLSKPADSGTGPVGYLRLRKVEQDQVYKIERVLCEARFRKKGFSTSLMHSVLSYCESHNPHFSILLSSQTSVINFYEKLGFKSQGSTYDDGGIEHVDMFHQRRKN